jgi:hypothetical protein
MNVGIDHQRRSFDICVVRWIERPVHFLSCPLYVIPLSLCEHLVEPKLYPDGLAKVGNAPRIFAVTSKSGLPYISLAFCSLFGCLAYMGINAGAGEVFGWFANSKHPVALHQLVANAVRC